MRKLSSLRGRWLYEWLKRILKQLFFKKSLFHGRGSYERCYTFLWFNWGSLCDGGPNYFETFQLVFFFQFSYQFFYLPIFEFHIFILNVCYMLKNVINLWCEFFLFMGSLCSLNLQKCGMYCCIAFIRIWHFCHTSQLHSVSLSQTYRVDTHIPFHRQAYSFIFEKTAEKHRQERK